MDMYQKRRERKEKKQSHQTTPESAKATGKNIQWFPGHMAKTRRMMTECLAQVDFVFELLDARIPQSSQNPEIRKMLGTKPMLTLLTKHALADPNASLLWKKALEKEGRTPLFIDCINGYHMNDILPLVRELMKDKLEKYENKGMMGRHLRAMVVGIPNVGKSTLINHLAGAKKAKAENRPGVTVNKQWIPTTQGLDLLDMPGVLWPKFEDVIIGENLAITGSIKDSILDIEEIAMLLCAKMQKQYPALFYERYKIDPEEACDLDAYDLFELVGRRRGFLMSGGVVNARRTAETLLDEFRSGTIGRVTLDVLP